MKINYVISLVTAIFLGISANPSNLKNNIEVSESIIKTETFNASYKNTSYSGTFEHLECTANIYNNNKIEIQIVHKPKRKFGGFSSYEFGKITYPTDTFYSKVDLSNSILHFPNYLFKEEIFEKDLTGFEYKYSPSAYGMDDEGELFTVTLIPTIYLNSPVTVNIFGHEISLPFDYDPNFDSINRLDANRNGTVDAVDASLVLRIYAENSTGKDIKTIGSLYEIIKSTGGE